MAHVPAAVRRVQIIEAATAVIAREGVAGASTRVIAKEAGVPLATLHYVFTTKDEVLTAVLESLFTQGQKDFERLVDEHVLAPRSESLAELFQRLVGIYWTAFEAEEAVHRAQYELSLYAMRTPAAAHLGRALYDFYLARTEEFLAIASEKSGETIACPVRDLAHLIVSGLDGVMLQALVHGDREQARRGMDNVARAATALATAR
nr:TetR/AcrR family transcriptional regulator [Kibdelosporangium sp. MJ126-NF4]CEL16235.1 Transcriptional regulator, TetR family [Kibdelosporangium sp. MJ126-NF4]CTQ94160.1 Transcriptional regulator, TetR family [Kibdelosporangium sp. MJ126-NF4]